MNVNSFRILVLGGTAEGRHLATELHAGGIALISSLAGRVTSPRCPPGDVRTGGFGGAVAMAEYIEREAISAVIDATHPFAATITANAASACVRTGTPHLVVQRPEWAPQSGDRWTVVADLPAAAALVAALDPEAAVLLTVGRQGVGAFAGVPQRCWLRAVEAPDGPVPARCTVLLDRGPYTVEGEIELMRRLAIDVLVTKNSGGAMTAAKLAAARTLDRPVIVVARPPLPVDVTVVADEAAALTWAKAKALLRSGKQ